MKVKQIVITGDEKELEYISRTLCGVLGVTTLLAYHNMKREACLFLETTQKTSSTITAQHGIKKTKQEICEGNQPPKSPKP